MENYASKFIVKRRIYGLDVKRHTIDSAEEAEKYVLQGVKLIATNVLPASII